MFGFLKNKIKGLGVCSLTGWIGDLFNPCLLLQLTADTKRQKRLRAGDSKLKAMATYSIGGEKAKPTIAELKIHDCTCFSHMTTLIEEIIWCTGGIVVR